MHQNIRGLRSKVEMLEVFLEEDIPDVVCLSEHSLLSDYVTNLSITNYSLVSSYCRKEKKGGGVAIWSRGEANCRSLSCDMFCVEGICEFAGASLALGDGQCVLLLGVYRPPTNIHETFFENISEILDRVIKGHSLIFVLGDFNIDLSKNSLASHKLTSIMASYGLYNVVDCYTREAQGCQSLIDHVFTNNKEVKCSVIATALSDHYAQSVSLNLKSNGKSSFPRVKETRIFDQANLLTFKSLLYHENWSDMFNAGDMDSKYIAFITQLKYHFDCAFPVLRKKQICNTSRIKITLTDEALKLKRELLILNYRTRNLRSDHFMRHYYRQVKYRYRKLIREIKSNHVLKKIQSSDNRSRAIWSVINESRQKSNKKPFRDIVLDTSEGQTTCPKETADIFNKFFINSGREADEYKRNTSENNIIKESTLSSLFLYPITIDELTKIISRIKNKKSSGVDQLPAAVIKFVVDELSEPLCHLINYSFIVGQFPKELKKAAVTPVFKKGCDKTCDNYRPVAILSTISKIFELAAMTRLLGFLEKNNIVSSYQHGFTKNRNTTSAIFALLSRVVSELDAGMQVSGLFFDLKKAFDTVNHDLLCKKMYAMGIRGLALDWFSSYLRGRTQMVQYTSIDQTGCLRRHFTSEALILRGVPQGSILGPTLFLLFVNNLPNSIQSANVCQYADDTSFSVSSPSIHSLEISSYIKSNSLYQWLIENYLTLSEHKTQLLKFTKSRKFTQSSQFSILLDETPVFSSEAVKFLGMIVDERLNFYQHTDYVASKVSIGIFMMRTLAKTVQSDVLLSAYYGLVYPYLVYAVPIWGSKSQRTTFLFKLQKKAVRVIFSLRRHQSCRDFFKGAKILTFPSIYILELLTFVKQNISLFTVTHDCIYSLRGGCDLRLPKHKTSFFKRHAVYNGISMFNRLPSTLKLEVDPLKFRRRLKALLLDLCCYSTHDFSFRAGNPTVNN